jgi:hypothetical protein
LIVTDTGRYVRVIACERVPNAITADPAGRAILERQFRELCRAIPDHQSISVYAQTDPIPIDDALAEDEHRVAVAVEHDHLHGRAELADARRWFLAAQKQSVIRAAGSDQPAVAARWWVVVPYRPVLDDLRAQLKAGMTVGRAPTGWAAHQRNAVESLRIAEQIQAQLAAAGIDAYLLDGVQALACLWERLHPAASDLPDMRQFKDAVQIVNATTSEQAAAHRHQIIRSLCDGPSPAGIDASDPRWLRHADGTLEEILHLGTPPAVTSPWWLMHLLACPLPVTVAVHISVGSRSRVQARTRRRWKRLAASIEYKRRRGQIVGGEDDQALDEAQTVDDELTSEVGATIYEVSINCALRDPAGRDDQFEQVIRTIVRELHAHTNARVLRGRRLCLPGFTSTIPLGLDPLAATRSYAQRNIAHCLPLTSSSCGSPDGLIAGFADPGGTLERINPFDRVFNRHVTLAIGPSGGGKTVLINALLERGISQGLRGWIIDRSSTGDDSSGARSSGHYDMLLGLVPGSRRVQVGAPGGDVICPWDVPDPGNVPSHKTEFLLALHALLIGDPRGPDGHERTLDGDRESLLATAIDDVYARCAQTGERPRETLLLQALAERERDGKLHGAVADALQSLIVRLEPYCEGGAFAHLADHPTTVPVDVPLTLFDIAGLPDRLISPMIFALIDHIEGAIHRIRQQRVAGELAGEGAWAGRLVLVVEEGWKLTASPAAGAWLNEYARRSRHYSLWLIFVSQHFKDLRNEQGRALLANSALRLCVQNDEDDLAHAREPLALTDTDIEQITTLVTQKGLYSSVYVISPRGRGAIRVVLGDLEYWICSSDPGNDQPRRRQALQDADGDHWEALRLLCTPSWHEHYRDQDTST